mgnify:CR=1 FL=1
MDYNLKKKEYEKVMYLINQKRLVKDLAKGTLSERRFNIYFVCYIFTTAIYSIFFSKEANHDFVVISSDFITATLVLIGSYLINGDKDFIRIL